MTTEEIAKIQKDFDKEVDSAIDYWAYLCFGKIEKQIKAQNTGSSKCVEGKIQIDPCRFYISRELNDRIVTSGKNFHRGGEYASYAIDSIKKDVRDGLTDINFYSPFSMFDFDQIYRIKNPDLGGGQYEMYFVPSTEVHTEKIVKGFIFKREKEIKKYYVTFKDLSLKLLKKLNQKCKDNGVKLTGIEILYWTIIDGEYYLKEKLIIDDIFGSVEGSMPWGNCILLRWKYQM